MGERPKLLTIGQAAKRLEVHSATLRRWADKGLLSVVTLPSGYRRFDPREIERVRKAMGIENGG